MDLKDDKKSRLRCFTDIFVSKWLAYLNFLVGIASLLLYLNFKIPINVPVYTLYAVFFALSVILITYAMNFKRDWEIIWILVSLIFYVFIIFYFVEDQVNLFTKFKLDENISYWFQSGILQGFSALLGIIVGFLVASSVNHKTTEILGVLNLFYPALICISISLLLSITLLPLSPVLSCTKYKSFLVPTILTVWLIATLGIFWLCYAIYLFYKNKTKTQEQR